MIPKVQQDLYQELLFKKQTEVETLFADLNIPTIEVFDSIDIYYRMRAEFRVWHEGDDFNYIMFEADPLDHKKQNKVVIDDFPIASLSINQMMKLLKQRLLPSIILKRKLFQVEFINTLSDELLISLIYHKTLDQAWEKEARDLADQLSADFVALGKQTKIFVLGRAHKQKIILSQDYVTEVLEVNGKKLIYQQPEGAFSQPNAIVCQKMLAWAGDVSQQINGLDLVELYCGHGTFSIALAPYYRQIIGTEISSSSVRTAQSNIALNDLKNINIARLSSEEFSLALAGQMEDSRRVQALSLKDYSFSTILVDPPRAGLDEATAKQCSQYDHIIYISCQPSTLKRDLLFLSQTHEIQRFAIFDQFPYTHHIESGVWLKAKNI